MNASDKGVLDSLVGFFKTDDGKWDKAKIALTVLSVIMVYYLFFYDFTCETKIGTPPTAPFSGENITDFVADNIELLEAASEVASEVSEAVSDNVSIVSELISTE